MISPFFQVPEEDWLELTETLVNTHPLSDAELISVVEQAWDDIFSSSFGRGFKIGTDIFPKPQIIGFLLNELIGLELSSRYPGLWRGDVSGSDKDLVYVPDDNYSIELKTSSNPTKIFANRSYAQPTANGKKAKSGYFLTVNFDSVTKSNPKLRRIGFGWIDSTDWVGQKSETGQQASLRPVIYQKKIKRLF